MRRILISGSILLALGVFLIVTTGASTPPGGTDPTYKIEFDNSFGLVTGADFKVAGVRAGTIKSIDLDQKSLHAVVTIQVTTPGLGDFHQDATCESRPQSLIGEYFVSCEPGNNGRALPSGSTIPVTHTTSTIAADLLNDIMREPYRQRLSLIINELGAAVAARSDDLQAALRRAVPALSQTDNLLKLLADDSHTLQQLTVNSDTVITALANNSSGIQRFITEANNAARDTAVQQSNVRLSFQKLPGFLEQLRPAMEKLGRTADANIPVLQNLNASSSELARLFRDLPGFAHASLPAFKALGQASVTGRTAVIAARPTIKDLNQFAKPTPELAQNLAIVGKQIDDRKKAVEPNNRSPGGKGFTGLEAVLQFVYNAAVATNTYGPFGHNLAVDAFVDPKCSPYATLDTIAAGLKQFGKAYRSCYAWLGPNQPGVNVPDPTNPGACVPDPGAIPPPGTNGVPATAKGPATTACKLPAADVSSSGVKKKTRRRGRAHVGARPAKKPSASSNSRPAPSGVGGGAISSLGGTISHIISLLGGLGSHPSNSGQTTSDAPAQQTQGPNQTQQLLNYLLAP